MKSAFRILSTTLALLLAASALSQGLPSEAFARTKSPSGGAHTGHPFGLGIVLGEPTGLSAKYFFDSRHALDGGLAYSFNNFVYIFADYLFHFPGAFGARHPFVAQLSPYLGIGGIFLGSTSSNRTDRKYFTADGSVGLGMRLPLGIEWSPGDPPLGVFVELVPGLGLIPSTFGFIEGGIGIRYYF